MVRNNDGTGSLKIVQPLDFEDQLQSNGFRFRIQVNDKVSMHYFLTFLVFFVRLCVFLFIAVYIVIRVRITITTSTM